MVTNTRRGRRPIGPAATAVALSVLVHGGLVLFLVGTPSTTRPESVAPDGGSPSATARPMFLPDLAALDTLDAPPARGGAGAPPGYRQPDGGLVLALTAMPPETFVEAVQRWDARFAVGKRGQRVAQAIDANGVPAAGKLHLRAYFTIEVRHAALRARYGVTIDDRLYALFPDGMYAAAWNAVRQAATDRDVPAGAIITRADLYFTPPHFAPVVPPDSLAFETRKTSEGG